MLVRAIHQQRVEGQATIANMETRYKSCSFYSGFSYESYALSHSDRPSPSPGSGVQDKMHRSLSSTMIGTSLPEEDTHACSVSLPTWKDVVGYEGKSEVYSPSWLCVRKSHLFL